MSSSEAGVSSEVVDRLWWQGGSEQAEAKWHWDADETVRVVLVREDDRGRRDGWGKRSRVGVRLLRMLAMRAEEGIVDCAVGFIGRQKAGWEESDVIGNVLKLVQALVEEVCECVLARGAECELEEAELFSDKA